MAWYDALQKGGATTELSGDKGSAWYSSLEKFRAKSRPLPERKAPVPTDADAPTIPGAQPSAPPSPPPPTLTKTGPDQFSETRQDKIVETKTTEARPWYERVVGKGVEVLAGSVQNVNEKFGDLMTVVKGPDASKGVASLQEYKPGEKVGAKAIGASLEFGTSVAGLMFAPISAELTAAEELPFIGKPVFGTINKGFQLLDEGSRWVGGKAVEALPVDQATKDVLMVPIQNLAGIVGTLVGVKAIHGVAETGGGKAVERLPVSEKTQNKIKSTTASIAQFSLAPFSTAFGKMVSGIQTRVAAYTSRGEPVTTEIAKEIASQVAKEVPVPKDSATLEIPTAGGKTKIETDQATVLQNMIKGKENITYEKVPSLGVDAQGEPITARFEYDFKNQEAKMLVTDTKTASNLLDQFGHPVDAQLGKALSETLGEVVPDFHQNQPQVTKMLADFALTRLDGSASRMELDMEIIKVAKELKSELKVAAAGEAQSANNKQFIEAFGDTLTKPEVLKKAPMLAKLSEHLTRGMDTSGEKAGSQGKESVLSALEKTQKGLQKEGKASPEFQQRQMENFQKAQAIDERATRVSANTDWREVVRALKNSSEYKKEGSASDNLINGTIMELNGRDVVVPADKIKEFKKRGYTVKNTMDGVAHSEGFESAQDYVEYVRELDIDSRAIDRSPEQKKIHEFLMETDSNYVNLTKRIEALREELTSEEAALPGAEQESASDEGRSPKGTPRAEGEGTRTAETRSEGTAEEKVEEVTSENPNFKTSKLSEGVEAKAMEKKFTEGFEAMRGYETINVKEQVQFASELLQQDPVLAKQIAMGEAAPPHGILPESVFIAVETQALKYGDIETLRALATTSTRSSEASVMGQRLRLLAERNPNSTVSVIESVVRTREKAAEKKLNGKTIEKAKKEIVQEIKKKITKPKDWASFIESIQC